MKHLTQHFWKNHWPKILSIFLFISLSLAYMSTFAVFTPGQTLDPNCLPGASGCIVSSSLSALTDDSTHRLVTDTEKTTWNDKQPLNTNLTSIGGLANAAGALTNNGAGVFSYVAAGTGDMILAGIQTVTGAKTFNDTKLLLRNVANTFNGSFLNTNTADRIYTLKDAAGTLAFTSDIGSWGALAYPTYVSGTPFVKMTSAGTFALDTNTYLTGSGAGVTAVSVATANGVSGSSSGGATPSLTIALGAITPTSTNGVSAATMAFMDATSSVQTQLNGKQASLGFTAENIANRDATGGYAGLTLFKINFKNAANTFTNFFTNATTAARTYTFPDKDITVAGLVDITGTNSGTNTGDNATNTQYSNLAGSKADVGQTFYLGTTNIAINRPTGALTLAGLTLTTPDLGTPSAGVATNFTGTALNLTAGLISSQGSLATLSAAPAGTLSGNTLASGVTSSSLTSVGTLGSLAVTGAVTGGTYNGQTISATSSFTGTVVATTSLSAPSLISTVAIGTAPITVTSTTKVANLNADLLDGFDSSAFGDATAANQTTILSRIGTAADAADMGTTLFAGQQYIWDNRASFGSAASFGIIGSIFQGGIVSYLLSPSDSGYNLNTIHGIIAAAVDQSTGIYWHATAGTTTGATATAIGTGNANTNTIVATYGAESNAAKLCSDLSLGGYTDWYLPSKDELNKLYLNRIAIGGFTTDTYWSSSEGDANYAWYQNFTNGPLYNNAKSGSYYVRCVRAF